MKIIIKTEVSFGRTGTADLHVPHTCSSNILPLDSRPCLWQGNSTIIKRSARYEQMAFSGGKMMNDGIEINKEGNLAEIILNRKETYNAFNLEMISQLVKHLAIMALITP